MAAVEVVLATLIMYSLAAIMVDQVMGQAVP
jgi:preprotein translocase subunit SecE